MTKIESAVLALDRALLGGPDEQERSRATENLLQAIADRLGDVVKEVPEAYYGLTLATARLFVTALELCADEDDLQIAAELAKMTKMITINGRGKGDTE